MVVCRTDKELEKALLSKEQKILLEGPNAHQILEGLEKAQRRKRNIKKTAWGIAALALIAAPFTGGTSLLGLTATAGAVALSDTVILAIISAIVAISTEAINALKEYKTAKIGSDRIEFTRK